MKVAIVYNDAPTEYYKSGAIEKKKELGFEAYFDVTDYDPDYEFEYLAESIRKQGYECYVLNIMDSMELFFDDMKKNKPDVIFNLMEIYKNKAKLEMCFAGLFELLGIPYTGADPVALGACQSKILTKQILSSSGINTARFFVCDDIKQLKKTDLNYPLIVKPAYEDASVGIENESIVNDFKELKKRIEYVLTYHKQKALVEEYIEGREINVAVFGNERARALPISEIDFSTMPDHLYNIISYQAKWDPYHEAYHKTIPICPAKLPKKIEAKAKETAIKAFRLMGCRDYARVDIRLTKDNRLYVLEVNPNPDLQEDAGFMRSAKAAGYSFSKTLKMIVDMAVKRSGKKPAGKKKSPNVKKLSGLN